MSTFFAAKAELRAALDDLREAIIGNAKRDAERIGIWLLVGVNWLQRSLLAATLRKRKKG